MSERRIFTHPSVRQSGDYYDQYTETAARLVCRTCGSPWADHNGWSCDGHSVTVLPDAPAVAHKCALCSVLFTPDADEQFIAAHAKVCEKRPLEVGDYVRLDISGPQFASSWQEGTLAGFSDRGSGTGYAKVYIVRAGDDMRDTIGAYRWLWRTSIRRIQRPVDEVKAGGVVCFSEQGADPELCTNCGQHIRHHFGGPQYRCNPNALPKPPTIETPWLSTTKRLPPDPLDTKYDGVTLRTLLDGDAFNRQEQGGAVWRAKPMTPVQRAAVSAHWSAELRAKLAASKERERLQVVVDDGEVGPWW